MTNHDLDTPNSTDIKRIELRTVRYWFEDGIFEVALGIFALILGLFFLGSALSPKGSTARFIFDKVGFLPVIVVLGWAMNKLARSLKQKLTYPRTGYIAYRRLEGAQRTKKALLAGGSAGLVAALAALLFTSGQPRFDWLPAFSGLAFAMTLVLVSLRSGQIRMAVVAVLTAATGVSLALAGWAQNLKLAAFYGAFGVWLILSGLVGLRGYLRRNPLPDEASR